MRMKKRRIASGLTVVLLLLSLLCLVSCDRTEPLLRFHFLDVGQGDSVLIRTSEGDILIDAGTEDSEQLLCLRLGQLGVTELELVVFTHLDEDHIGGGDGVLSQFPTKEVWVNGAPMTGDSAIRLQGAAEQSSTKIHTVRTGEYRHFGEVLISVLAPVEDVSMGGNAGSIVLKVHCGAVSAILTGDAGAEQEERLVSLYGVSQLSCDLYKVGHHGSSTSSSRLFLETLQPTYAVISCGAANSYGHPMGEVLARLEACGATVLRTDLNGEIVFETDGTVFTYVKDKNTR